MKVRNGFVSNSSGSSFVCDVSGAVKVGYDVGPREMGFLQCPQGHCFLEDYKVLGHISADMMRRSIINMINSKRWWRKPEHKQEEIVKVNALPDADLEGWKKYALDYYEADVMSEECPICTFTKPRNAEFVAFLLSKLGWTEEKALSVAKQEFNGDYASFVESCKKS